MGCVLQTCWWCEVVTWEALFEMESFDPKGVESADAAATLVVDLAKAFEKVQLTVDWQRAVWFKFPQSANNFPSSYRAREKVKVCRFIV